MAEVNKPCEAVAIDGSRDASSFVVPRANRSCTISNARRRANHLRDLSDRPGLKMPDGSRKERAAKNYFHQLFQIDGHGPALLRKNFSFAFTEIVFHSTHPASGRGAYARSSRDARRGGGGRVGLQRDLSRRRTISMRT